MNLFVKVFNWTKSVQTETKHISDTETEQINKEFEFKVGQVKDLFFTSLNVYNSEYCQCAYPRFHQIVSIDCRNSGHSFKCYDTDLLINLSKPCFNIQKSELNDECINEQWTCKKCGSIYEYGWSDFSIYVERQKLKLKSLKVSLIGKSMATPIPLFVGLMGHSYPPKKEIAPVSFADFEKYMTEK